ncbi:MAG: DoxX family protein [Ignavibacteria bacterium]
MNKILSTNAPSSIVLVRFLIALVFVGEGIQKFLFPQALGTGRFIKIGIPAPEIMAPFVGVVEIAGGLLVLFGLFTRFAALALTINISVAIITTKIPMLFKDGIWPMLHESRVDFCMFFGCIFLLIVGGGLSSIDHKLSKKKSTS